MKLLTKHMMIDRRETRYRRRMNLRVTTKEQAVKFVNDVGFCFLFPIQGVEMPSLWDAVAGRVMKTTNKHSGYEIERTWGWKDEALGQKLWFYGKLLRSRATLVSLDFLPNFYALSENYGDYEHDYLDEYRTGALSAEAKTIYEALLKNGALDAIRLRRESRLSAEASKSRFEKALTELQVGLKVLPIGIAPVGAWRYAFIYELLPRWLPDLVDRARAISRTEARRLILDQYIHNVIATPLAAVARGFGWKLDDTKQVAEELAAQGRVELEAKVTGIRELQLIAK
ncbi:hypothetical protein TFLX_02217 [Thermoflexales bacterium]|nr:hypothetical protein TFLX_02217 [Thermoflexales bacterium]